MNTVKLANIVPDHAKLSMLENALASRGVTLSSGDITPADIIILACTKEFDDNTIEHVEKNLEPNVLQDVSALVLLEKARIPAAFKKLPRYDLSRWRGSFNNNEFKDLVKGINTGRFRSASHTIASTVKRFCAGLTVTAVLGGMVFFAFNILSLQQNLCSINFAQPSISDLCGKWGLGGKPEKEERIAWERLQEDSCEALRKHIDDFPNGAFRDDAADRLLAARKIIHETWHPEEKQLSLFVGQDGESANTRQNARQNALTSGASKAEKLCRGFANSSLYRLISSSPQAESWNCTDYASGTVCGFEGVAICSVETRKVREEEVCGPLAVQGKNGSPNAS